MELAFTEDVRWILGRPNFTVAEIGRRLHTLGLYDVRRKAEDEQASALHFLLSLYLRHGASWRWEAEKILTGAVVVRTEGEHGKKKRSA